jgi:hypothetical protein
MERDAARQRLDDLVQRYLRTVSRAADAKLAARVGALARFQAGRLAATYADLQQQPRYRPAVDFFLTDLYGPQDLRERDEQVLRALDRLKRFLPGSALDALARAFELHVLTIELDAATAAQLGSADLPDGAAYAAAYRAAGRRADRARQIALIGEIGSLLDTLAHHPEVGLAIRLARGPAHAAGYGQLQDFLERGYDAFRRLDGAREFLAAIDARERRLMEELFAGAAAVAVTAPQ